MAYFGLMRVGELATGEHQLKAADVRISKEKRKIVLYLRSSKTHTIHDFPQKIEIHEVSQMGPDCPLRCILDYIQERGMTSQDDSEPFFMFKNKIPFTAVQFRNNLRLILRQLGVDNQLYDTHSYRAGRCTDLQEMGFDLDSICDIGPWSKKSTTILNYIRKL